MRRGIPAVLAVLLAASLRAQSIVTVAGGGSDDGQLATAVPITAPRGIAVDAAGNIYFAESGRIRRVDAGNGTVKTIAGNGASGLAGDGGLAVNAVLNSPRALVFDAAGNLYIADAANDRVRRIDAKTGVITTFAGGGTPANGVGDGGAAKDAIVKSPNGLAVDRGFLYVTEAAFDGNRLRKIDLATNVIDRVAGAPDGSPGFTGDGGLAKDAKLDTPFGLAIDAAGNIFIADTGSSRVRRIDAQTLKIDTYAGGGNPNDGSGDNLPATQAKLAAPVAVGFDGAGNLLISCVDTGSLRKVDKNTKIITTFASGVYLPTFIAVDSKSVLWSSDDGIVYRVASDGTLTPLAGGGTFIGDGRVATAALLQDPTGVALAANGDLYIADTGHNVLRRVSAADGRIATIAGRPGRVYVDDQEGVDAADAIIGFPRGVVIDSTGAIYISDINNTRIWRIDGSSRKITTYVSGVEAWAMAFDGTGNLLFVQENSVSRVDKSTKTITVIAGQKDAGFSGDGGQATQAKLQNARGVAVDADGNIYVVDQDNGRIRKIDRAGVITTVAGGDNPSLGDDGPATSAQIGPRSVAVRKRTGDLFITDGSFHRVRRVTAATKVITTVAGSANFYTEADFAGDGGRATAAKLNFGYGQPALDVNDAGDVYFSDIVNNRVRAVFACAAVATPVLSRPGDGTTNVSTSPTLSWTDTLNAFRYDVLLDTVSPPVKVAASDVSETSFTTANLQPSTKYFWKVIAKGDPFCATPSTASSATASFTTTGSCAASPFDAVAPADGAQVQGTSVLLSWNASSGASSYDVFFSANSSPSRIAAGVTATSFRVDVGTGTYSWFIVAHASCDGTQTASTTLRSFTVIGNNQNCPQQFTVTASAPANGATDVPQSVDLTWSANGFADNYDLYLGTTSDPPLFAANVLAAHQVVTLDPGTKYFWRVAAHTPCVNTTPSSAIVSFTTRTCSAPGATSIVFAPQTVTSGSTYSIVWSAAPGLDAAGAYLLDRSSSPDFSTLIDSQVISSTAASFLAGSPGSVYHRVRAVSGCDPAKIGQVSDAVRVTVIAAPPNIVFTVQPLARIVDIGQKLEDVNGSFTLENIGSSPVQVIVGRQELNASPPFFSIVDPGGQDAAFITLDPHKPHAFTIRYSGPPNNVAASYQGVVFVAATGAGLAVTPYAFVNLKVGGTVSSAAPQFVVDGVVSEYAAFPALSGDDTNRAPLQIGVRNSGSSPIDVGFEIGPEVWLTTDATWNATRIEPNTTRTVNLLTKRSRAPNGSALPRYTYLTVRTRDGAAARLLVQDNGDFALASGRTARLDVGVRSFIVPEVVSKTTSRGVVATRLRLTNVGSDPVQTQLIFTPAGADGFDPQPVRRATVVVPPNDVVTLTDPIVQVFKLARPASGQLEVRLPAERVGLIAVSANSVSFSGSGSIAMPVVNRGDGARLGAPQIVSGITRSAALVTSVVFAETSGNDHAQLRATLRDSSGAKIGADITANVPRYGYIRFDDVVTSANAQSANQASLEVRVESGGGAVAATAILTPPSSDGGAAITGRPEVDASSSTALARILRDGVVEDTPSVTVTTVVPLVPKASSSGSSPTYQTLLGFGAAPSALTNFVATFYPGTGLSIKQTVGVPAGTTRVYNNVLSDLFGLPATANGSVFVQAPSNSIVYALVQPLGSGPVTLPPASIQLPTTISEALTSAASSSQRPLFVDGLEQSIDPARGSRWMLLLNEVAGFNGVINVRLYEAANRTVPIAEKDISISGQSQVQLDTVFSSLGLDEPDRRKDRTNVQCVVTAKSGNARVSASAIGIDNATGATQVIALAPSVGSATPSVSLVTPVISTSPVVTPRRRGVRH